MRLSFHPLVQKDINAILRYYDGISAKLGDRFFEELAAAFDSALDNPERGHPVEMGLRRLNLNSFPFHFLYRILPDRIRVTIVSMINGIQNWAFAGSNERTRHPISISWD